MTINDRFQSIINIKFNGNKTAFAKIVGVNPTVIENVVGTRKGKPSFDLLSKVYSNANIEAAWLLTGEGPMDKTKCISADAKSKTGYISSNKDTEIPIISEGFSSKKNVNTLETRPRIPYEAAAGSLSIAIDSVMESECEQLPIIPSLPKYDFTIITRGDSMAPDFLSGDELACSFIRNSRFIQWGRPHVLDTAQGIVVKRIFDHNSESLICRSINPDYPDFEISKDEIYHIALVVGLIRHF